MSVRIVLVTVCAAALLSGCGEARRALGYEKNPPDEFAVVSRAPLSIPPEFALRPPTPGAPRPQEGTTRDQARAILLGGKAPAGPAGGGARSPGERALLDRAGADEALPNIRFIVDRETSRLAVEDRSFTERLVFWRDPAPFGDVVDPAEEARRLRRAQALGEPVTSGETPIIKRREKGMFEGIF